MSTRDDAYVIRGEAADPVPVQVMARAYGYVMVRRKGRAPFVVTERELDIAEAVKRALELDGAV